MCVREKPKEKRLHVSVAVYEGNIEMRGGENERVRQAEGQTELEEGRALMALSPRCR